MKGTHIIPEAPRTSSVPVAALKRKRMNDSNERKKEKMLNGKKGGKSIKVKVTGKKVARE